MSDVAATSAKSEAGPASDAPGPPPTFTAPLIYRAMKVEGGRPMMGTASMMLGARVPQDVAPDGAGNVLPAGGGMSVQPRLLDIPAVFLPRRLKHLNRNAGGSNNVAVWRLGSGPFVPSPISPDLRLLPDRGSDPRHGVIEPAAPMKLAAYQSALQGTRDQWVNGES